MNKTRKFLILPIFLLLLGVFVGCTSTKDTTSETTEPNNETAMTEEKSPIIVGTSGGYRPYTYADDNNNLVGFDVEVWEEIGKRIDREVQFKTASFSGLFGMLDNGQVSTLANQITITPERSEKYLFTAPYVYNGAQLIAHKDSDITSLEDLKGKKVGVSLGSNYETLLRDFDTNNEIEIITYESFGGSLIDVNLKRIDAVLNDKLALETFIAESDMDLKLAGDPVDEVVNAFPFVKSDDNAALIEEINTALQAMTEDGTLTDISLKYLPIDITKK